MAEASEDIREKGSPARMRVHVEGIVQGVGFRPFIYRLACEHGTNGYVCNTPAGVEIEVEGTPATLARFLEAVENDVPPLGQIVRITTQQLPLVDYRSFEIRESGLGAERSALIPPDVSLCEDCRRELFDPTDRRYLYPFINCTNCGPRYTIIHGLPYDRKRTSMRSFAMCPECEGEYQDPTDRRFHAQPDACWACGPRVSLLDPCGEELPSARPLRDAVLRLQRGEVVAIKGLGGFHLAVDATNANAVRRLRRSKLREEKPFAVMAADLAAAERFARISQEERLLLTSPHRPIVLLGKKHPSPIAGGVAPRNRYYGVMLPYTPLHELLFRPETLDPDGNGRGGTNFLALVMTSGNRSDEPLAKDAEEALDQLGGIADAFIVHDRDIAVRCDDSVVRISGNGKPQPVRRARGYAPAPVVLPWDCMQVLACGAEMKNTFCLTKGRHAFLSQHTGDLENMETLLFFKQALVHLTHVLDIHPQAVAYDLHPDYLSTRFALEQSGVELVGVQHHHAHIASAMAEHGIEGPVIGLALDGTGYGADGRLWGGEVLVADLTGFDRAAHFEYLPLPGGARAIEEPWRMAASYLCRAFGSDWLDLPIAFVRRRDRKEAEVVTRMAERAIRSPLTSSCGRLFDAVAAVVGLRDVVSYEGQAAQELEAIMEDGPAGCYPYEIDDGPCIVVSHLETMRAIVGDLLSSVPPGTISRRFHDTLVALLADVCARVRERTGLAKVVLSGGSFQNAYLDSVLPRLLAERGFEVYTHAQVPPNDGGIALGQAVIASFRLREAESKE